MPLPGFNPLEQAPPPGSTEVAASAAQAARLHQRISDLERRLSETETGRGTGWTAIPSVVYTSPWASYGGIYTPSYRIEGRTVHLTGLCRPSSTASTTVLTLPDFLRPEPSQAGAAEQYIPGTAYNGAYVTIVWLLYPRTHASLAGQMVAGNFNGATNAMFVSLAGVSYLRRSDM